MMPANLTTHRNLNLGLGIFAFLWMGLVYLQEPSFFAEVEALLMFGMGIIAPLSAGLTFQADRNGNTSPLFYWLFWVQTLAIPATLGALLLESGWLAGILAGVWFAETIILALWGLARFLPRPTLAIEEMCIDAGLVYSPVSGIWLIAYCFGYPLFTFDLRLVILTAVHFTFISLGALVMAGMIGRVLYPTRLWRLYRWLAASMMISPWLVATGITLTQLADNQLLELFSAILLAFSLISLSALALSKTLPRARLPRFLLVISLSIPFFTMLLAVAYPLGRFTGWWSLTLSTMVTWHGWFNAIGFIFFGLLAWAIEATRSTRLT